MKTILLVLCLSFGTAFGVWAQASGVPVIREGHGPVPEPELVEQARVLRDAGQLLSFADVKEQMSRSSCHLALPSPRKKALAGNQLWSAARQAHLRVGYLYFCTGCKKLHLRLAGGYAVTADGAVATCFHVLMPKDLEEAHLVAITEAGTVLPVTEILASDKPTDVCLLRVKSTKALEPLPLNVNIVPGDEVWCYSDPVNHPAFFTHGIVNRFFQKWDGPQAKVAHPQRMNVSTDWAPGSSGAAVLDHCGNAVGQVCSISAGDANLSTDTASTTNHNEQAVIIFHDAIRAADVLALIKR